MLDMHTHVWPHAPGTPTPSYDELARYCDKATANGIEHIAITEHSHRFTRIIADVLPSWDRPRVGALAAATDHILEVESGADLDAYVSALTDARDRGLPLLVGLEVDHLPGTHEAMNRVLADYPFDVLLGSVHWLDAWLFDAYDTAVFADEWERRDLDDVWTAYVDAVSDLAGLGLVDVLAHLDLIRVAGHALPDDTDQLVRAVVDSGLVVEVSSAGLRKPMNKLYPNPQLLRDLAAAGCRFTTASDAHRVEDIGRDFDRVRAALRDAGITELVTFDQRRPEPHPLD